MRRRFAGLVVVLAAALGVVSCYRDTPAEAGRYPGTVNLYVRNSSSSSLWILTYDSDPGTQIQAGESLLFSKINNPVPMANIRVAQPLGTRRGEVTFSLVQAPTDAANQWTVTLSLSTDSSGLSAVSDRPDIIQVVSVVP